MSRSTRHQPDPKLDLVLDWTSAMLPGFRPRSDAQNAAEDFPCRFTAEITMEPHAGGTKYRAVTIHADEDGAAGHKAMGFHEGWGAALDQLVALVKRTSGAGQLEHA